jgi:uncharacterized RDD family membrane protein YckC
MGRPVPVGPTGEPLAEFTDRLLARLIDGAILGAVGMLVAVPAMLAMFAILADQLDSEYPSMAPTMFVILAGYGGILLLVLLAGRLRGRDDGTHRTDRRQTGHED